MKNKTFPGSHRLHPAWDQIRKFALILLVLHSAGSVWGQVPSRVETVISGKTESPEEFRARMQWWKEARFGLFIHWGLYAVPAGQWGDETNHAEWIRTTAQIPLSDYEGLLGQFNPVNFDAREWVRLAKAAGMKYIVITTKHHDGFSLFDSKNTEFDVMSTPFRRDIMKELAGAAHEEGIAICWYHSILDWHHPDYLPRLDWEKDRSAEGADFDRYVAYMNNQLRELLTNYGKIGVLWFDGEWGGTWDRERGRDLYNYVKSLQPDIIINNRVGKGRMGMGGLTGEGSAAGDFGTPEQQIPATGIPGIYWETCMTMNDHWGYNRADTNWKTSRELIRMLADIASKGGNFLLNVGPTAEGVFPPEAVERLEAIGNWMSINGTSIYGTDASPFDSLSWGRCTRTGTPGGTRLFLHVFDWPPDGRLVVPGIFNSPEGAWLLAEAEQNSIPVSREEDALVLSLPGRTPDPDNSVVVLDVAGVPDASFPPAIDTTVRIFIDTKDVLITTEMENVEIRYTLDGSVPTRSSRATEGVVTIRNPATVSARCFRDGRAVSGTTSATFTKVIPVPAEETGERPWDGYVNGVSYRYVEGDWDVLPRFDTLTPVATGTLANFSFSPRLNEEYFGFEYTGYLKIPAEGVYTFTTDSDDGSRLWIGDQLVVDNDGLHSMFQKKGDVALSAGLHGIRVGYFEKTGGDGLTVEWEGPGFGLGIIPDSVLYRKVR